MLGAPGGCAGALALADRVFKRAAESARTSRLYDVSDALAAVGCERAAENVCLLQEGTARLAAAIKAF